MSIFNSISESFKEVTIVRVEESEEVVGGVGGEGGCEGEEVAAAAEGWEAEAVGEAGGVEE